MTDITFDLSGIVVNLRVGALVQSEGNVLICRIPSEEWWYVPGGRIAVGEPSIDAISRELSEELEGEWAIGSLVASSENFFTLDSRRCQEICFYYAIEWLSDPKALTPRLTKIAAALTLCMTISWMRMLSQAPPTAPWSMML